MSLAALPGFCPLPWVTGMTNQERGAVPRGWALLRALQVKLLSFPFPQCPLLLALKNPLRSCWGEQEREKSQQSTESHRGEMIVGIHQDSWREGITAIRECLKLGGIHQDHPGLPESRLCHCCSVRKGVRRGQELGIEKPLSSVFLWIEQGKQPKPFSQGTAVWIRRMDELSMENVLLWFPCGLCC